MILDNLNSIAGTMWELYKATYRGVVRVTVVDLDQQTKSQGNAFVICKNNQVSILLTRAYIFGDSESSKSVHVVASDFKHFIAKVWRISKGMDICLLLVKDDLGSYVVELNTDVMKFTSWKTFLAYHVMLNIE